MKLNSTASHRPLEYHLFSLIFIGAFIIGIAMISFMLYPKQLTQDVITFNTPEPITEIYLQQLMQDNPNNITYLIALTEQSIGLHHDIKANLLLQQLAQNETQKDQFDRLQFIYTFTKTFQLPKGKDRDQAIKILVQLYPTLLNLNLTSDQFIQLGDMGLKLETPQLALTSYEKGIALKTKKTPELYRKIASTALQSSQYKIAAYYDILASQIEPDIDLKRQDIVNALNIYRSGNLMNDGIRLIQTLPYAIVNNEAMLEFLAQYALAAGRPDIANTYMKRVLLDTGITP